MLLIPVSMELWDRIWTKYHRKPCLKHHLNSSPSFSQSGVEFIASPSRAAQDQIIKEACDKHGITLCSPRHVLSIFKKLQFIERCADFKYSIVTFIICDIRNGTALPLSPLLYNGMV
ncbi:uncharacterized protein [Ptychodera flava]|uniref:uncharacterized protein n=1 Tax=Ptychodera flava TaxID=63121 RepID=UPI00396A4BFE